MLLLLTLHFCFSLCAFAHTHMCFIESCLHFMLLTLFWWFVCFLRFVCLSTTNSYILHCFLFYLYVVFVCVGFQKPITITHFSHTWTFFRSMCSRSGVDGSRWESMGVDGAIDGQSMGIDQSRWTTQNHKITKLIQTYENITNFIKKHKNKTHTTTHSYTTSPKFM